MSFYFNLNWIMNWGICSMTKIPSEGKCKKKKGLIHHFYIKKCLYQVRNMKVVFHSFEVFQFYLFCHLIICKTFVVERSSASGIIQGDLVPRYLSRMKLIPARDEQKMCIRKFTGVTLLSWYLDEWYIKNVFSNLYHHHWWSDG